MNILEHEILSSSCKIVQQSLYLSKQTVYLFRDK